MKKMIWIAVVVFVCGAGYAGAGVKVLTLKDGTRVQGQITGISNGRYIVSSDSLGEISVKEEDVLSILAPGVSAGSGSGGGVASAIDGQMQQVQAQMLANPQVMTDIQALATDPDVVKLISDPAFMEAARNHDVASLQSNPRTMELMNNPKVKALIEKLKAGQ